MGGTVEGGVSGGVDGADVLDGFGGALVTGGLELSLAFGPVGILIDLGRAFAIHGL